MRLPLAIALLLSGATAGIAQPLVASGGRATVEGVVLDSADGGAVAGAYVWLVGTRTGAVTDVAGRYSMPWRGSGMHALHVRICGREDVATGQADRQGMRGDVATVNFMVARPDPCAPLSRPPWAVGPQDTTAFVGHLVYSWEGTHGGFLVPCSGSEAFAPKWADGTVLWDRRPEEGARQFVRLLGRYHEGHRADGLNLPMFGSVFYASRVVEKRPASAADCALE